MRYHSRNGDLRAISGTMQEMNALDIHADIYIASVLLPALHSARADAPQLSHGVIVDATTSITVLEHLVRSEDDAAFDAALAVIEHLEACTSELAPTALCGIERRVWRNPSLAARYRYVVIEKMKKHQHCSFGPTAQTIHIIKACCENSAPEAMRRAVVYYRTHKIPCGPEVWSKLMDQLIRRGKWKLADELADDLDVEQLSSGMRHLLDQARARNNSEFVDMDLGVEQ
ncbi:uncharacterized protein PHACADRAFT_173472 [Phanerochaete carnosa HHB-10118-sp]|uniref:Uncharacterized protein n=1 Tax=Phanerochaete carnosa (strain HHB-10118-sp) TaxID=650164 RepID=K5UYZ2_PHACS|nr:uncharacterized protein PHACADRAFT_173472 [Phanerochaete carnosa HHB-10118-sp]EKM55361.1 hypothetical protein PHACADRAFT_173472 [Phanerochaete carnosa HHB-10118-sp]